MSPLKPTALLIDHDDSFTHNVRMWMSACFEVEIIHHSKIFEIDFNEKKYNLVIFSPGPRSAQDYPHCIQFLSQISKTQHILGICLGMQMMSLASGGSVKTYSPPLHGKTSALESTDLKINDLHVARYHSMYCTLPADTFFILATSDQQPMWVRHVSKKWMGFQFHPESFMTEKSDLYLKAVCQWISE